MKNKIVIHVMSQPYMIITEEPKDYVEQIAKTVNKEISEVTGKFSPIAKQDALVLATMNLCDRLMKTERELEESKRISKAMEMETADIGKMDGEAKKEIYRLRGEVMELKQRIKKQESKAEKAAAGAEVLEGQTSLTDDGKGAQKKK